MNDVYYILDSDLPRSAEMDIPLLNNSDSHCRLDKIKIIIIVHGIFHSSITLPCLSPFLKTCCSLYGSLLPYCHTIIFSLLHFLVFFFFWLCPFCCSKPITPLSSDKSQFHYETFSHDFNDYYPFCPNDSPGNVFSEPSTVNCLA